MTWEVEEIRDFKDRRGKKEYPVHWKGYPDSDDSRVKEEDIDSGIVEVPDVDYSAPHHITANGTGCR